MVKDEGIGVSKEQLKRFKQGEPMAENKTRKHIGVENVRDRIHYLYGEDLEWRYKAHKEKERQSF